MTVSIVPGARMQFQSVSGVPLVGGTVEFYQPGTFVLATTYQDSLGTITNPHPITLDQFGSAAIWGNGSYRQIVSDALGNVIWDAVTSVPASSTGALLATNNLSDLQSIAAALANLGLGTAALANLGINGGTVPLLNANCGVSGQWLFVAQATFAEGIIIQPPFGAFSASAGYLGVPLLNRTTPYAFTIPDSATDAFFSNTGTATIPNNSTAAYVPGEFLVASWPSGTTGTLAGAAGVTIRWLNGNVTGSRTITGPGFIAVTKKLVNEWWVTGGANIS